MPVLWRSAHLSLAAAAAEQGATVELEQWDDKPEAVLLVTSATQRRTFILRGPAHDLGGWKEQLDGVLEARANMWRVFSFVQTAGRAA